MQLTYEMSRDHLQPVGDGLQRCTLCQAALLSADLTFDIPSLTLFCGECCSSEEFVAACNERVLDAIYQRSPADKQAEQEMAEDAARQGTDVNRLAEMFSR